MSDWRDDAECLDVHPESFFPNARIPYVLAEQIASAKAICATCDVAAQCLDYALTTGQNYGIYGGLDEKERRKLARKLGISIPKDVDEGEPEETRRGEP
jgi:WhiB family redox-sensing transcriptional regulator